MRKYCKAYNVNDLRKFPAWEVHAAQSGTALMEDAIVYLWDDLTVVESPMLEQSSLFESESLEWKKFCRETLGFSIPEDL